MLDKINIPAAKPASKMGMKPSETRPRDAALAKTHTLHVGKQTGGFYLFSLASN